MQQLLAVAEADFQPYGADRKIEKLLGSSFVSPSDNFSSAQGMTRL